MAADLKQAHFGNCLGSALTKQIIKKKSADQSCKSQLFYLSLLHCSQISITEKSPLKVLQTKAYPFGNYCYCAQ